MPIAYAVDHTRRRLTLTTTDPVTFDDVRALFDRQAADSAWGYATLHDLRAVTGAPATRDVDTMVRIVSERTRALGPHGPVAFVAKTEALYGMGRMYAVLSERTSRTIDVFRSVQEAEAWLDGARSGT